MRFVDVRKERMPRAARIVSRMAVLAMRQPTKFWIQDPLFLLVAPTEDLNVQPWLAEAQRGVPLARWGVCAPETTRFEVKGALLDPYGNEVIPSKKIGRHHDIHHYGFS
jgi:hypothetical protein